MWVQTFGPASPHIQEAVAEANAILKSSTPWIGEKKVIGVVNKKPKNLGEMILKKKHFALDTSLVIPGTSRCTPLPTPGLKKPMGRPCGSCGLMSGNDTVSSSTNGRVFKTPSATCKTKNIVYCATCIYCSKQYVGKSTCKLQTRISGHRTHMHDLIFDEDDDEATLAEHLKFEHNMETVELFNLSFLFTILQLSPFNLDESEQKWVSRLTCMKPFGLNKEVPRGVTDSVHTMFRKSLGRNTQRKV